MPVRHLSFLIPTANLTLVEPVTADEMDRNLERRLMDLAAGHGMRPDQADRILVAWPVSACRGLVRSVSSISLGSM